MKIFILKMKSSSVISFKSISSTEPDLFTARLKLNSLKYIYFRMRVKPAINSNEAEIVDVTLFSCFSSFFKFLLNIFKQIVSFYNHLFYCVRFISMKKNEPNTIRHFSNIFLSKSQRLSVSTCFGELQECK